MAANWARVPFLWLIALGGVLNLAAIAANGGVMPADPDALAAAGIATPAGEFSNSTAVADAKLQFLGDVLWLPSSWPVHNVFSIGDVLIVAGAFLALHTISGSRLALRALATLPPSLATGRVTVPRARARAGRMPGMSSSPISPQLDLAALRGAVRGDVTGPGDDGYDGARRAWNLVADQRPAAVVHAGGVSDVAAVVRFAAEQTSRSLRRPPVTARSRCPRSATRSSCARSGSPA